MTTEPAPGPAGSAPPPRTTDAQVDADHAAHASRHPERLVATLLRTRSVVGRRVLALLAGGPGTTPARLEELGRRLDRAEEALPEDAASLTAPDPALLCQYARVVALQTGTPADVSAALGLLDLADALSGGEHPTEETADLWAQLLVTRASAGDARRARQVLRRDRGTWEATLCTRTDLRNPHRAAELPAADAALWEKAFTRRLGAGRGSTVRLAAAEELFDPAFLARHGLDPEQVVRTPFDRLLGEGVGPVDHPYRVTVVMSTLDPGPELLVAARSLVSQTWQNWELLVVDDASTAPTPGVLEAVAELDARIRVIRKAVHGGTYRCRNTALRQATGDAVTFLDSDDWAHPDLLETGVRPLLEGRDRGPAIATRQRALRVTEELHVTRPGYPGAVPCAPSLMMPMVPGVSRIGFFDPVRKGADTEYARRLEAATGREVEQSPRILVLMRRRADSLSAGDFSRGWRHGARHEYQHGHAARHARIAAGEDPWLDPDGPRRTPAPLAWRTAVPVPGAPRPQLDLVLAGDWRRWGGPQRSMLEEIRAALGAGLRVGVLHLEALRFMRGVDDPLCAPLQELLDAGRVTRVHLDDAVEVDLLLLRYPPILQHPPLAPVAPDGSPATLRPRQVVVVANQAPCEADGSDQRYTVPTVETHARELFGTDPLWAPQGPVIRRLLAAETSALTPWDDPALVELPAGPARSPGRPLGDPPVVGRVSRDDRIKFPADLETLRTAYDHGPEVEVVMLGAEKQVRRLADRARADGRPVPAPSSRWTVLPQDALPVEELLATLDVFVYADHPGAHEAFGRTLLEAAAHGVPVVATPKHRPTFGDLFLYAEPHEMPAVVRRLLADPGLHRSRVEHQLAVVRERYSHASFVERVRSLLPRTPAGTDDPGAVDDAVDPSPVELRVAPTGAAGRPLEPTVLTGDLTCATVPLRRPADAERADALVAVGGPRAVQAALGAHADHLAAGRDEQEALAAAHRTPGVRALLLARDGELVALVPPATTWRALPGRAVHLTLPPAAPTEALVWRLADPAPAPVTVPAAPAPPGSTR
ncbi:Glycosyltransferase involved in cell wall bisynthesis [Kytococcus aerolatus]|uniref:Glycosyltransferase involved in cell wall bisynthesis n=1 Tax=Kytococcus aerolatus TaxID=592308 RepID=A0A212TH56_9MICO|nr:glycosyltransferase [Kytococcus aerolatus]SNC65369.1 Glycosyltransferase involved in cell wall bisynthesis [Kytococcus aerolatus]